MYITILEDRMVRQKAKVKVVADICLYGTRDIGIGWLAQVIGGKLLGNGEPIRNQTSTEAVWLACHAINYDGISSGRVRIFAPRGEKMAVADLNHPGYYGDLKWQAAIRYTIDVSELSASSGK